MQKNPIKKIVTLMLVVVMALSFAGCGKKTSDTKDTSGAIETTSNETTSNEVASSNDASAGDASNVSETIYPISITDSERNEVFIEKEPQRIVSVAPNLTEVLCELGCFDRLVARSNYCDYPAEVLDIESVGELDNPDIEKILSLEPDLILASTHFSDENAKKITELGIPVLFLHDEQNMNGMYNIVGKIGLAVNKNKEANICIESMKSKISDTQKRVEDKEKPSVYYVIGFGEYGDYTATGDTFISEIIETAGGDNIGKESSGWYFSLEQLIEDDPDYILLPDYYYDEFITAENYCNLTAVKEGKVIVVDNNTIERQGIRNADAVVTLSELFHPQDAE